MPEKQFSYNKKEKLKSRKQLQLIFTTGETFIIFPLKIFYQLVSEQDVILKTGVGVSSKNFKRAVDRNRIKRLLRESFRTEKTDLYQTLQLNKQQACLFLLYIDKTLPEYALLIQKMQQVIKKLTEKLNETVS